MPGIKDTVEVTRKVHFPKDKKELLWCFSNRVYTMIGDNYGLLGAIEYEDGSGYSFNVKFSGENGWHYVKFNKPT